nr:hypothetical protein [Tanacetum cinerariifolium]
MDYEKPSTKLTFYKAFFSSQWKFLINTILQSVSAKHTLWNEFSSAMASAVICLSTGDDTATYGEVPSVTQEPSLPSPTPPTPPPQPPQDLPSTSQKRLRLLRMIKFRVGKQNPKLVADASTKRRKGVIIRDPKEESTTSSVIPVDTKSKDKGKGIMIEEPKPLKKKQQVEMDKEYARKLHAKLNKDIGWDAAIDHTKEQIEEEESRALQSINETPAQKAAKRRKLNEKVEDLKRHLEIVPDEDDNNFDRKDLEALWSLVKERFSTSKPKNFSDYFLLNTIGAMFEKPDRQAQVWKNQRFIHGQAKVKSWKLLESCGVHIITFSTTQQILLVERRYPLSRFTLDQLLNAVRLQVEEESEMSLELLRFTRQ